MKNPNRLEGLGSALTVVRWIITEEPVLTERLTNLFVDSFSTKKHASSDQFHRLATFVEWCPVLGNFPSRMLLCL